MRFRDLVPYGVKNWVTLNRWIEKEGAPAGFYLGSNTRAWFQDEWDNWLANRPSAAPPEIVKPAPLLQEGSRRVKEVRHQSPTASDSAAQATSREDEE